MSEIRIQNISITDLATDAIVNAANEGLWAGGGVCGAIFRAAGHDRLQEACNKIGHCDTGSAVITPGFRLKAKYVIHAVGPVWRGGKDHEPELLYGAYYRALELAKENGWEVAIKACRDFLAAHPDYDIEIVFAVLDERIIKVGQGKL